MVIKFRTLRTNELEMHEKGLQLQKNKEMERDMGMDIEPIPFHNDEDWFAISTLEMDTVIDWIEGRIWYNRELLPCVQARLQDGLMSSPLMVTETQFRTIFEKTRNEKVQTADEILNQL